jgi:NitT/TauT family transport system permease protein
MKSRALTFITIVVILAMWEFFPRAGLVSQLSLPSFSSVLKTFGLSIMDGTLLSRAFMSLKVVGTGYLLGALLGMVLAAVGVVWSPFWNLMRTFSAILHPIPGVAMLPLAILWFGIGTSAIIFTIVHAVLWPTMLSAYDGFKNVPTTYLEVAKNLELSKFQIVTKVLLPSAFSEIITGLKIGWARAWRALVGGEMVFGATGESGGLGWFIYEKRFFMDTAGVFAGLVMIALLGILVEYVIFGFIQKRTIEKWNAKEVAI